jgi:C_GCAxxG_C_C family probable redox protein
MKRIGEAVNSFKNGLNCSQALLSAFSGELGLDKKTAKKIASGFGGGMGCTGETCGAVTGAVMVIGLRHGDSGKAAAFTKELLERFRDRNGTVLCRSLLDCDISTDEGMAKARKENLFTARCPKFVEDAAGIVEELVR